MKRKNINNKGITLITLVITIIVIVILASVATYNGVQVIESSKLTRFTAEMKLIQAKINEIYEDENKKSELQNDTSKIATTSDLGTSLNNFNDWGYSQDINSYKKYTKADLKKIGVDDIQQEKVLIDFENRKVISCEGVKADGTTYYVLEQLPNSVYNVEYDEKNIEIPTFNISYEIIENEKFNIIVSISGDHVNNWKIKYKKEGQNNIWNNSNKMNFVVNEEGTYNIKIENGNISSDIKTIEVEKIKIGDYVSYDEMSEGTKSYFIDYTKNGGASDSNNQTISTEDLKWRVLGINNEGQIELISDRQTTAKLWLGGETGYLNAKNILDDTCKEVYGKGKYAENARSLNVEDINKITNYDPKNYSEYGNIYKYRFPQNGNYMQYSQSVDNGKTWSSWNDITGSSCQKFRMPGTTETISSTNRKESKEIKTTGYYYNISDMIIDENIIKMLEPDELQWLNTDSITQINEKTLVDEKIYDSSIFVGLFTGDSNGMIGPMSICSSYSFEAGYGVQSNIRPVVILKNTVKLMQSENNIGDFKEWNIDI